MNLNDWLYLLFFALGIVAGIALLIADEKWLYKYYYRYLFNPEEPDKPTTVITRSLLFLVVYWPLALYVVSTGSSWFGQGLVLGIGLKLGLTMWQSYRQPDHFKQVFSIPVTSKINGNEIKIATYVWWVLLVILGVIIAL